MSKLSLLEPYPSCKLTNDSLCPVLNVPDASHMITALKIVPIDHFHFIPLLPAVFSNSIYAEKRSRKSGGDKQAVWLFISLRQFQKWFVHIYIMLKIYRRPSFWRQDEMISLTNDTVSFLTNVVSYWADLCITPSSTEGTFALLSAGIY